MSSTNAISRAAGLALVLGLATTAGCVAPAYVEEPVGYTEVTYATVPVDVYAYPSTVYGGHVHYYVGNRWVYRDHEHWVQYRTEPPPLYRYRPYVQQAPPAPRPHDSYQPHTVEPYPHRYPYRR